MKKIILYVLISFSEILFCGATMIKSAEIILKPTQTSQKEITKEQTNPWRRDIVLLDSSGDSLNGLFRGGSGAYHWTLQTTFSQYVISKRSNETGEVTEYDISGIFNYAINERNIIMGGNRPPWGCLFNISPDDRYVLICLYGNESIVYDTQENTTIRYSNRDNSQKEKNEVKLGFDKDGNIYCGTQDISPMFLLRKFPSGDVICDYRFKIEYLPDRFIPAGAFSEMGRN